MGDVLLVWTTVSNMFGACMRTALAQELVSTFSTPELLSFAHDGQREEPSRADKKAKGLGSRMLVSIDSTPCLRTSFVQ